MHLSRQIFKAVTKLHEYLKYIKGQVNEKRHRRR